MSPTKRPETTHVNRDRANSDADLQVSVIGSPEMDPIMSSTMKTQHLPASFSTTTTTVNNSTTDSSRSITNLTLSETIAQNLEGCQTDQEFEVEWNKAVMKKDVSHKDLVLGMERLTNVRRRPDKKTRFCGGCENNLKEMKQIHSDEDAKRTRHEKKNSTVYNAQLKLVCTCTTESGLYRRFVKLNNLK